MPGGAVAEAAEVDAGEDDLAVALRDAPADLAEHGVGAAAARRAAHERDHAERARERAAVLDLDEGADAVEPRVGLDAADRADVAGDGLDRLLDLAGDDGDVRGQPGERSLGEPGAAAGHVDARMRARGARGGLARLREALVRDAAGVDDGDVARRPRPRGGRRGASRSRSACASVCETLQPRKRTEKLAIERERLLADVQVRRPAAVLDAPLDAVAVELGSSETR